MKRDYLLYSLRQLGEGLFSLEHIRWGKQWWTLCVVRKNHICTMTAKEIRKGEEAYRPITNKGNRYERIITAFFESSGAPREPLEP